MASPTQILADPNFHALPLGERLKAMRTIDPNFAALPAKEQGTVLYQSAAKFQPTLQEGVGKGPEDQGFLSTLGHDLFQLPDWKDIFIPGYAPTRQLVGAAQGVYDTGKKAVQAAMRPGDTSAGAYAGAAMLPIIGPLAAQAGEEYGAGQSGQATAHALEALLPMVAPEGVEGLKTTWKYARAAGRGAAEGAGTVPIDKFGAMLGEVLGHGLGHPGIGATVGGTLPKAVAAGKGAMQAVRDLRNAPPPSVRTPHPAPAWTQLPQPSSPAPATWDYLSNAPDALPSGRIPGRPVNNAPARPDPAWTQLPEPSPQPLMDLGPSGNIPTALPSGRVPGRMPTDMPNLTLTNLPGGLPAQSAAQPLPGGLHLPEVPAHYGGEPNPIAAFRLDQDLADYFRKQGISGSKITPTAVQNARRELGRRPLAAKDVERRVWHLKILLPE